MMILLHFILATCGLTWIFVKSKIIKPLREFSSMMIELNRPMNGKKLPTKRVIRYYLFSFLGGVLSCGGCFGFWAGAIVYIFQYYNCELIISMLSACAVGIIFLNIYNYIERK